jgi:hypothetical protein
MKTFFGNSTPATGSCMKSNTQGLDFPLMAVNGITRKRGKKKPAHNSYKAKFERLCLATLVRHDQAVGLLDMTRLQVVKDS